MLASLALTVICQSVYNARFLLATGACWLVDPGSSFFDLLSLDKSSSVLLFLIGRFGWNFCLFLHDCHIMATVVLFSSRRRRRASISGCCEESADDAVMEW